MVTVKAKKKAEKESVELLELAVSCKLLTRDQEQKVLSQVLELSKQGTTTSLARFLYEQKFLEKDQIEFLFAVKKHLDTLMLDKKFGKLGVANEFVSRENVKKALDIQVEIFKQRQKSVKIGDILFNNNEISDADRTAILLTQDRIRDECLAEALNAIATSQMERTAINKRFGAIAVKKNLITTDQLNQALKLQKKQIKKDGKHQYLGQIFEKIFDLSEKQTLKILKIQKKLEARRMNLQKKVFAFNVEKESVKTLDQFLELSVADDKLSAFVVQKKGNSPEIAVDDVLNWLSNAGIKYGICNKKEIQDYFKLNDPDGPLKIARGKAPVQSKKEQVSLAFEIEQETGEDIADALDDFLVKKDDVIASVTPFEEGVPGKDVLGHPINIEQDESVILNSGEGVSRRDNDFIAMVDGRPRLYKNRTLFVLPAQLPVETKQVDGDVTPETADDYQDCNVTVSGSIAQGATLACHDLVVKGNVLGNVSAAGDIEIDGDIGDVENSDDPQPSVQITTKGRLAVNGKSICAKIVTDNGLLAPKSSVVNSRIFSSGDVIAKNILSSEENPTVVRIAKKNLVELQKLKALISQEQQKLDELSHQPGLDALHAKLMKQVQVQNGYLEKQNVLSYLVRILDDPVLEIEEALAAKIEAFETRNRQVDEKDRQDTIPENTKAFVFMKKILAKTEQMPPADQEKYVRELMDSIDGIYKSAVKGTERINKKYDAMSLQVENHIEKHRDKIAEKEKEIKDLLSQRDYLLVESNKAGGDDQLLIKIKNELGQHTIIKGEAAKLIVDEAIFGVFVRERGAGGQKEAEMLVDGYFE